MTATADRTGMRVRWLLPLALVLALACAPIAEASASGAASGPLAAAAKKKKKKKCKAKKKKKQTAFSTSAPSATSAAKKKKKGKCKKKGTGSGGGLPGKPLNPNPPDPPDPPEEPEPRLVQSLTLTENPLLGGSDGQGRVTLDGPAPADGQPVSLGTDTPSRVGLPASIHIAAGQTQATFPITTTAGPPTSVILTAAIDTSFRTTQLDIVDEATLESVELDYQCFPDTGEEYIGNFVRLNVRAPDNAVVSLSSDQPFALAVPPSVIVPDGSFTGAFTAETMATTSTPATVTAEYDGVQRSDTAEVRDSGSPAPVAESLVLQPDDVEVGDPSTGTVSLDCEATSPVTVDLSTAYPGLTVPPTVTIPAGSLSASFQITTTPSMTPGDATITATEGVSVQATLQLRAIGS